MTAQIDPDADSIPLCQTPHIPAKKEILFHGIPASAGICIGQVFLYDGLTVDFSAPPELKKIHLDHIDSEILLFESALDSTRDEIKQLKNKIGKSISEQDAKIFDVHLLIAEDRQLHDGVVQSIRKDHYTAECAFILYIQRYLAAFAAIKDPYIQERASDIKDVSGRILGHLRHETSSVETESLPKDSIIIAKDIPPSDVALLDFNHIKGFAIESGSRSCHTSILARSMGLPAIVGMHSITNHAENGDTVLIDGSLGMMILNPCQETLVFYREKINRNNELMRILRESSANVAETTDGYRVQLCANLIHAEDVDECLSNGAQGIGLLRTEFMFLNTPVAPDEEQQYQVYSKLLKAMGGRPVTIRTIDIGGDKLSYAYSAKEANPFLGQRAIRLTHVRPELMRTQLRALLRAGIHGDLRIMIPMVTNLQEVEEILELRDELVTELQYQGLPHNPRVKIGIMIEIPSAALIADELAKIVDFFSIGTNDLVQYTLAVDRMNENVSYLYQPGHSAVLQLIQKTVQAARRHNIYVSVCGELAADPYFVPILIGLDVLQLSMSPSSIGPVREIVRRISKIDAERITKNAMSADHAASALMASREYIQDHAADVAALLS